MISGVQKVNLPAEDLVRARDFWVGAMGFELVSDAAYDDTGDPQRRWVELVPPDKRVVLVLSPPEAGQSSAAGRLSCVLFECEDIEATHRELTGRGVQFTSPPAEQFYGWSAIFTDPDGHLYVLNQRSRSE